MIFSGEKVIVLKGILFWLYIVVVAFLSMLFLLLMALVFIYFPVLLIEKIKEIISKLK